MEEPQEGEVGFGLKDRKEKGGLMALLKEEEQME